MINPKYDVFVCSRKIPDVIKNMRSEEIMAKLYQMLRRRLNEQGFGNTVYDTECYTPDIDITREDLDLLEMEPVFISEHYISKDILMSEHTPTIRVFKAPWRTRPSMDAYSYVNRGKAPMFHAMFIGGICAGKSYVMNEFKLMIRDLSSEIEVIECENGIKQPEWFDITTDLTEYATYKERVKANGILIAGGPSFMVGIDDVVYHNTKI